MDIENIIGRLKSVRTRGNNQYTALCPAHDDSKNSFSAKYENCRVLLHCFAGCTHHEITTAMGLSPDDFTRQGSPILNTVYYYQPNLRKQRNLATKEMWWQHMDKKGDWLNGVGGVPIPLYNHEAVAEVQSGETVYIVEGEKDADTMKRLGLTATTLPNGAASDWKREYTVFFEKKNVVILPDNDEPGKGYADKIARNLLGVASSIKILDLTREWEQLTEKGDITDVVVMNSNDVDVVDRLRSLETVTAEYTPFESAPKPLESVDIQAFPIDCFPPIIASFVQALSANTQTALEMAGVLVLGVLSTVMQGRFTVKISETWREQLSLYTTAIAAPGERKSAVVKHITDPIIEFEINYNREFAADVEINKIEKKALERRKKETENDIIVNGNDPDKKLALKDIMNQLANFEELHYLRLAVNDASPEKLIDIMDEQGGKIAIVSGEGNLFDLLASRNDRGTTLLEPLLKGWSGDRLTVDRITRGSNIINHPHISAILTVQPHVIDTIMRNSEFSGRGLLARFLFVRCTSNIGERVAVAPDVPNEIKEKYRDLIFDLLNSKTERIFYLSSEAERQRLHDVVEKRLVNEWESIREFGTKFIGTSIRIAGLIHGAENKDKAYIGGETFTRAVQIAECLGKHTEAVYLSSGTSEDVERAKYIISRLKSENKFVFTKGEMLSLCQKFKLAGLLPSLKLLEDHDYIRVVKTESGKKGRPMETIYLNPEID